jgi:hypothetical protein
VLLEKDLDYLPLRLATLVGHETWIIRIEVNIERIYVFEPFSIRSLQHSGRFWFGVLFHLLEIPN